MAFLAFAATLAQGQEAGVLSFSHSPSTGGLRLLDLALSPRDGQPHLLVGTFQDPHDLDLTGAYIVRGRGAGTTSERTTNLEALAGLRLFAQLALTDDGEYVVAYSGQDKLNIVFYDSSGRYLGQLKKPLDNHLAIALLNIGRRIVLVTHRGIFDVSVDGTVRAQDEMPSNLHIVGAFSLEDSDCGLFTIVVDQAANSWQLQRRCVTKDTFAVRDTAEGPPLVGPGTTLSGAAILARSVASSIAGFSTARAHTVALAFCSFEQRPKCIARDAPAIPNHHSLILSGEPPLARLDSSRTVVFSAGDEGRNLWWGVFDEQQADPVRTSTWMLPVSQPDTLALADRLLVKQNGGTIWFAYGYWSINGNWTMGHTPTRFDGAVAVRKITAADLAEQDQKQDQKR